MGASPTPARVAIRADASVTIGTGHVRRCASLALALEACGAQVRLLTRDLGLNTGALVRSGLPIHTLPTPVSISPDLGPGPPHLAWAGVPQSVDADDTLEAFSNASWWPDIVVVDHYALDASWHLAIQAATDGRIVVIDDLADRMLAADYLVDHNWHRDHQAKYRQRLLRPTRLLAGPNYALLDPAYATAPRNPARGQVESIGVFMGGSDAADTASRVLDAIALTNFLGTVEVVSTSANPHLPRLSRRLAAGSMTLTLDEPNLAAFFARHDLHIGAGGGATWERFCIGAPSILLSFAVNHDRVLEPLRTSGLARVLLDGWGVVELAAAIDELISAPDLRQEFSGKGQALVDGRGCQRVANQLLAVR